MISSEVKINSIKISKRIPRILYRTLKRFNRVNAAHFEKLKALERGEKSGRAFPNERPNS